MNRKVWFFVLLALLSFAGKEVSAACHAKFGFSVSGFTVNFYDSSTAAGRFVRSWTFGDGSTSDAGKPIHKFGTYGSYHVCLKIRDSVNHCDDTYCETVTIKKAGHCNAEFHYTVSGSTVSFTSDSNNAHTAKFGWNFGDATHSRDRNPSHTFSKDGVYQVCLEVNDSPCTDRFCHDITIGHPKYCISGNIYAGRHDAYPGYVLLYKYNAVDSTWSVVDTARINYSSTAGARYEFGQVEQGTYIVKAVLDSSSSYYKRFLPAYHERSARWGGANRIVVYSACAEHKNIYLHETGNHSGKGHIRGHVHNGHKKQGNDEGIEVILFDANDSIASFTATDANGDFDFTDLDFGQYKVYVEVTGLPTYPAVVNLSTGTPEANTVYISIEQTAVYSAISGGTQPSQLKSVALYPNPAGNTLNLDVTTIASAKGWLTITDMQGRLLMTLPLNLIQGPNNLSLDLNTLGSGMYLLNLHSGNDVLHTRFIKE